MPAPVLFVGRPVGVLHGRLQTVRPETAGQRRCPPVEGVMPVGAAPPVEQLERLRAQTERLLDEAADDLCLFGGRVLPVRKIGGLSARKVAYWVEKGEYPTVNIPTCESHELCIDCGRFALTGEPEPEPEVIPPPPPVPAAAVPVLEPVLSVPAVGAGGARVEDAPQGASSALVPVSVPRSVPDVRRLPGWVRWLPVGVVVLVVLVVAMTVAVQGLSFGVSTLREAVPEVDVDYGTTTPTTVCEVVPDGAC